MAKLTDTQLIVLSKAAAREDGMASISTGLNKAAAAKVGCVYRKPHPIEGVSESRKLIGWLKSSGS